MLQHAFYNGISSFAMMIYFFFISVSHPLAIAFDHLHFLYHSSSLQQSTISQSKNGSLEGLPQAIAHEIPKTSKLRQ